jgi:MOSC domain-containing protein YiiM
MNRCLSLDFAPFASEDTMPHAQVVALYLHGAKGADLSSTEQVRAVPGCGLEGDRMFRSESGQLNPDQEITLIEAEAIEAVAVETGIRLRPSQTRRQIITQGVRLNELVGKEFKIGEVTLRGHRFCQPCDHLESLTQSGVKAAYHDRAGLRAQIVTSGMIRVGDAIVARRSAAD